MKSIFALTGAGISAESGIQTFRGSTGLWEGHKVEDVASPAGFQRNPALVFDFYNVRRAKIREAQPNAAHLALARLEKEFHGTVTVVTQNIDDLHERAGSRNVIHMHGEAMKARCRECGCVSPCENTLDETNPCPACAVVENSARTSSGSGKSHSSWTKSISRCRKLTSSFPSEHPVTFTRLLDLPRPLHATESARLKSIRIQQKSPRTSTSTCEDQHARKLEIW